MLKFGNGGNMENTDLGNFLIRVGKFDVSGVTQLLKYSSFRLNLSIQRLMFLRTLQEGVGSRFAITIRKVGG